jgi:hypothetical protein
MVNAGSCGLDVSARLRQGVSDVAPHEITKSHDAGVPDQGREAGADSGGHSC